MNTAIQKSQRPWSSLIVCALAIASLMACSDAPVTDSTPELPPIPDIQVEHLLSDTRDKFNSVQQQLKLTPVDGHYNVQFARLLHAYSLHAPAAVMYRRCRLLRPSDLDCIYLEALTHLHLGNNAEATRLLSTLLERKPDFPRASVVLADGYRQQGRADLALPLFKQAVNADRKNLEAVYGLAMSLMEQEDLTRARTLLESLHGDGRQFGIVHAALANLNRQSGNLEATAFHTAAARRYADTKIPFVDAALWAVHDELVGNQRFVRDARAHFQAGRLREAAVAYVNATTANPEDSSSHTSLIGIYAQLGNMIDAQRHFTRAREISPNDALPLVSMGTAHMKRGDFAAARFLFAEAIELQPEHAEARTLQAYCVELLGDTPQPDEYRRALRDDPTQSLANYLLGRHIVKAQDCQVALPHFRASIRIESARTPAFISELVRCLVDTGEQAEARSTLQSGIALAQHYNNASALRVLEQTARELADQLDDDGS